MSPSVPPQPSLEYLKKQAKALLKAHKQADPAVIARIKQHHPRLSKVLDAAIFDQAFSLRDAQLVVAHEQGFASWPQLAAGPEGRVHLCSECADILRERMQDPGGRDQLKGHDFFLNRARQLVEKHRAGDGDAIRRVNQALPQWHNLAPEEISQAPLQPEEAQQVLLRESAAEEGNPFRDDICASVQHRMELEEGESTESVQRYMVDGAESHQAHRRYLEDQVVKLVDAHGQGHLQAARRIKAVLPQWRSASLAEVLEAPLAQDEAQRVIACEFGVESWAELLAEDETGRASNRYFEALEEECKALVEEASRMAADRGHGHTGTEHVLLVLLHKESEEIDAALSVLGLDRQGLEQSSEHFLGNLSTAKGPAGPAPTTRVKRLMKTIGKVAEGMHNSVVDRVHFLLALIKHPSSGAARIAADHGVDFASAMREIQQNMPAYGSNSTMYTGGFKRALQYAREQATSLGHGYIGTEHLLLGAIRESKDEARKTAARLGVSLEAIKQAVGEYAATSEAVRDTGELPFTPRARAMMEVAASEARGMKTRYVDVEHLLLALVRDREAGAAKVLAGFGIDYERVRGEVGALRQGKADFQ
jgi:hypothetical protein